MKSIKNFCIIAHIDHGKSTLSDRLIELTQSIEDRDMKDQILDNMDLERERGITIKLNAVRLSYGEHQLNLIDTPGHADFSYEVYRSLSACEGAILVIDATQSIQAQTIANFFLALKANLAIVVALNKIDMPAARVDEVKLEVEETLGMNPDEAMLISAKSGEGVSELLEKCIEVFPSAKTDDDAPLKALIFDAYYDSYKGVVFYVRVFDGVIRKGDRIRFMYCDKEADVIDIGIKTPIKMIAIDQLNSGEVGWIITNFKRLSEIKIGDTLTHIDNPCAEALPGYEEMLPMIYASFFPLEAENQTAFKTAVEKLSLSDGAFEFQWESSNSLGFGCRLGFLGLLHMDIVRERLRREYDTEVMVTHPSVKYEIHLTNGEKMQLTSPSDLPDITRVNAILEPYVLVQIQIPKDYIGRIMEFMDKCRSKYVDLVYLKAEISSLSYEMPLSEIIYDFYDSIKSLTNGYGIIDYKMIGYQEGNLVKVDVLINGVMAPSFSFISEKGERSYRKAKHMVNKLKENIPPHLFVITIQAVINNKVICREDIKSIGKNVTEKLYGGDITRKKKLWEKQKKGKKRMKQIGKVNLPPDIFKKVFQN